MSVTSISVVSHGHGSLVSDALQSLALSVGSEFFNINVCVTFNLPESELHQHLLSQSWPFDVCYIHNRTPLGFGANHNQAFANLQSSGASQWFVVMNPDIYWPANTNDFWSLLKKGDWRADVGLLCPVQVDRKGVLQDFARKVMTPWSLALRVLRKSMGLKASGVAQSVISADWVNGSCMVWRSEAYAELGGFDERYFMYCEDTDICLRLQLGGWSMQGVDLTVVHDARRNTGRSWQHLAWHLRSLLRLWRSDAFWCYLKQSR